MSKNTASFKVNTISESRGKVSNKFHTSQRGSFLIELLYSLSITKKKGTFIQNRNAR